MKKISILILTLLCFRPASAQYDYTVDVTAEMMVEKLQGDGITILNPVLKCSDSSNAVYQGAGGLGVDTGILISNSRVHKIFRPHTDDVSLRPNGYYSLPEA